MKHLQHKPFYYDISLKNNTGSEQELVFRIFIAPVKDEAGREFSLREQRSLMIEMDKFVKKGQLISISYKKIQNSWNCN